MFKYAFLGFGITFACLLTIVIPIVHFVTVPLAPLIGGWTAGYNAKATPDAAIGIGVLMGVLIVIPVAIAVIVAGVAFSVDDFILRALGFGIPALTVVLGSIGAIIGGGMSRSA